jgi:hypothetical protein
MAEFLARLVFVVYIATYWGCDYRRGMGWILDLLIQLGITVLSLIYTSYKSLAHSKFFSLHLVLPGTDLTKV